MPISYTRHVRGDHIQSLRAATAILTRPCEDEKRSIVGADVPLVIRSRDVQFARILERGTENRKLVRTDGRMTVALSIG
jgi:hypothetical protein